MVDIDSNLLIPIITAIISGVVAIGAFAYNKIRPHICVTINCWFCNENSRIPLSSKNSFICSSCRQYNGFTKDGDYNRDIPAQRMENLNYVFNTTRKKSPKVYSPIKNGLCHACNVNQSLKVKSLAEFQPFREDNYELEIEEYRQRLDRIFSLCRDCEGVLHQTLGKQNLWLKPLLLSYKLMQSRMHIMKAVISTDHSSIFGLAVKVFLIMAAYIIFMATLYNSDVPENYLFLQYEPRLAAIYSFGKENSRILCFVCLFTLIVWLSSHRRKFIYIVDYCSLILWTVLLGLTSGSFSFGIWSLQLVALLTFLATCITVSKKRSILTLKNNSPTRIQMNEHDISPYGYDDIPNEEPKMNTPSLKTTIYPQDTSSKIYHKPELYNSYNEKVNRSKCNETSSDNSELGSEFGSLKISTPQKNRDKSFSAKSLFTEKNNCILAQPKLFSKVTQASWVAGGYWGPTGSPQKGRSCPSVHTELTERRIPPFSSSRSSSHSSGFISQNSGTYSLMDSGRASLCSETDRVSQLSESAFMYPHNPSHEHLINRSRSPTLYSAVSCGLRQSDIHSSNSSLCNDIKTNFNNFSLPNKSVLNDNGDKVYERLYVKYCNPLVAFILGISITANFFLFFK